MPRLTVFLARYIGLFTILLVGSLYLRGPAAIDATIADGTAILMYGIVSLAVGLAIVIGHNVWRGGVLPVVVTLLGWLILAKALALVFVAPGTMSHYYQSMGYDANARLYLLPSLVLGVYLTIAGFSARAQSGD
jgi:hypothetical protein